MTAFRRKDSPFSRTALEKAFLNNPVVSFIITKFALQIDREINIEEHILSGILTSAFNSILHRDSQEKEQKEVWTLYRNIEALCPRSFFV
jgi:hypothetical protein